MSVGPIGYWSVGSASALPAGLVSIPVPSHTEPTSRCHVSEPVFQLSTFLTSQIQFLVADHSAGVA